MLFEPCVCCQDIRDIKLSVQMQLDHFYRRPGFFVVLRTEVYWMITLLSLGALAGIAQLGIAAIITTITAIAASATLAFPILGLSTLSFSFSENFQFPDSRAAGRRKLKISAETENFRLISFKEIRRKWSNLFFSFFSFRSSRLTR